jgi:hypothetical protein
MSSFADDGTLMLGGVLFVALFVLFLLRGRHTSPRRSPFRDYSYRSRDFQVEQSSAVQHFGRQLQSVMMSSFEKRKIMNVSEYRLFRVIEEDIASFRKGYRVFAQTCLGEILQSKDEDAFYSINSKRVDILVVDQDGWPVVAVEYQGEGHYRGTAAARDAIKKEALRKAGVRYLEVVPGDSDEKIRRSVREYLGLGAATPPSPSPHSRPPLAPPASAPVLPPPASRSGFGLRTAAPH